MDPDAPEIDLPEPAVPDEGDGAEHVAEIATMPHAEALGAWRAWKQNPTPQRLADTLNASAPVIDRAAARLPRLHRAIVTGEAKRLAIGAIKTYDPSHGTSLSTHLFNHLRPLGRNLANVGRGISQSRLDRQRSAAFLSAHHDLSEEHGREPDDAALCDHLGVDTRELTKMRLASRGEVAEAQADHLGDAEDNSQDAERLRMWTDFTYHDATPLERQILDLSTGRNGHQIHDGAQIAARLSVTPQYVNRKRQEIAHRILDGINSMGAGDGEPEQPETFD